MTLLIIYVLLALSVSFLCSVLEAVLLSVTPSYLATQLHENHVSGKLWQRFKADIDRPLAAILSLNTIAHTVGAAGAGAQATGLFGEAYFGIISAVLTLLILVLSEIVPKTLGAVYWRQLAPLTARVLVVVIGSMYPLVRMAQGLTRLLSRRQKEQSISREEFVALAEMGVSEGVFAAEELRIVTSLLRFRALTVRDVMTPRPVIYSLPEQASVHEVLDPKAPPRFSRIPVYAADREDITGYIRKDELLLSAIQAPDTTPLTALRRQLLVVPENLSLHYLQRRLLEAGEQLALVVDEYGDIAGLVTMEDLVETLLGLEIVDETDTAIDMRQLARDLWLQRAKRLGVVP